MKYYHKYAIAALAAIAWILIMVTVVALLGKTKSLEAELQSKIKPVKNCWCHGGYKSITVHNEKSYRVECKDGSYYEKGE